MHFDGSYKYCFAPLPNSETHAVDTTKPYLVPIISEITRACFKLGDGSYLNDTKDGFKTSDGEYEMPEPLLALAGTLVHAALAFVRSGTERGKNAPFRCVNHYSAYLTHLGVLESLKTKVATAQDYHPLLRKLYRMAAGLDSTDGVQQPQEPAPPAVIETNIARIVL
ncbi:hypothetical protein BC629DRAFT_1545043, partial [Irpex lacteus]